MAVRIQNGAKINHGTLASETVVTHGRLRVGNANLAIRPLSSSVTVAAGGQLEFDIGDIDIVFPANEAENAGLNALLALALDGTNELNVDGMTSSSAVITTSGYSQQSTANWTRSNESD